MSEGIARRLSGFACRGEFCRGVGLVTSYRFVSSGGCDSRSEGSGVTAPTKPLYSYRASSPAATAAHRHRPDEARLPATLFNQLRYWKTFERTHWGQSPLFVCFF